MTWYATTSKTSKVWFNKQGTYLRVFKAKTGDYVVMRDDKVLKRYNTPSKALNHARLYMKTHKGEKE